MFNLKNLLDYHDLYVQSDTLFLADVFKNFRNKWLEIYELDPAYFLSAPGLAWQAWLKNTEVDLESWTNTDMLLMVEKGIKGGTCHAWIDKLKQITDMWKIMMKTSHHHTLCI